MSEAYDLVCKEYLNPDRDIKNTKHSVSHLKDMSLISLYILSVEPDVMVSTYDKFYKFGKCCRLYNSDLISLSYIDISDDCKSIIKNHKIAKCQVLYDRIPIRGIIDMIYGYSEEPICIIKLITNSRIIWEKDIYWFPYQLIKDPIPICSIPFSRIELRVEFVNPALFVDIVNSSETFYLYTKHINVNTILYRTLLTTRVELTTYKSYCVYGYLYNNKGRCL